MIIMTRRLRWIIKIVFEIKLAGRIIGKEMSRLFS